MDILEKFLNNYSYKFDKGYPDMDNDQDVLLLESILNENGELFSFSEFINEQIKEAKKTLFSGKLNERFLDLVMPLNESYTYLNESEVVVDYEKRLSRALIYFSLIRFVF